MRRKLNVVKVRHKNTPKPPKPGHPNKPGRPEKPEKPETVCVQFQGLDGLAELDCTPEEAVSFPEGTEVEVDFTPVVKGTA